MTAAYRSFASAGGSLGADPVVSVPSGTQNGDLLLMWGSVSGGSVTTPAGWNLHANSVSSTQPLWWRIASSEPASYTVVVTGVVSSGFFMVAISGVDTTTPIDSVQKTSGTGNLTIPAASPTNANSLLAQLVYKANTCTWTGPGSQTERFDASASSSNFSAAFGDEVVGTGSTGTRQWNPSAGASAGVGYNVVVNSQPPKSGSAAATFEIAGSSTGKRVPKGSGAATLSIAGASTGTRVPKGSATAPFSIAGASTGARTPKGSATAPFNIAGAGSGARASLGAGAATFSIAGAATGSRLPKGAAAATYNLAGAATGKRVPKGSTSSVTYTLTGVASGSSAETSGSAVIPFSITGSASGARASKGSAAVTFGIGGSGTSAAPHFGNAAVTYSISAEAVGNNLLRRNISFAASGLSGATFSGARLRLTPVSGENLRVASLKGKPKESPFTGRLGGP